MFYMYNDPPDCMLSLDMVEDLILERFQLYTSSINLQDDTEEFLDCDKVAHIFMSIIAVDCSAFKPIYMTGELNIFKERLTRSRFKLKNQLPKVLQYLKDCYQNNEFKKLIHTGELQLILSIIETLVSKSKHFFNKGHSKNCRMLKLILPFTFLWKLVAKREVEVKNGKVCLYCGNWDVILVQIAQFLLGVELKLIAGDESLKKNIFEVEDDKIRQIVKRFENFLSGHLGETKQNVKAQEIDKKSLYFPPCMATLHQILRQTHRLSYSSRFQYTLFLKDIGLPFDENIQFWENEYNKPNAGSSCTHEWEEKEKRYKYQIQHLYGMVGTHGLKTSHSCEKFIQNLEAKMDGGCPFQHFSSEDLRKALPRNMLAVPDVEEIFKYKNEGLPQKACGVYLKCQQILARKKKEFQTDSFNKLGFYILSPVQYYSIANTIIEDKTNIE